MSNIQIQAQQLSAAAFAPYGTVIGAHSEQEPDFANEGGTQGWRVNLQVAKPLYMTLRTPPGRLEVTRLERHLNVSQTFLPLGGGPAVLVVCRPTEGNARPRPEDAVAFLLEADLGYALHIGTWHSLDRLPVGDDSTTWLMVTDSDTQDDLAKVPLGTATHTQVLHLPTEWGLSLEIEI